MEIFPWDALPTANLRWRRADGYITGEQNVLGEGQRRNPSPGFRWRAELTNIALPDDEAVALWEALMLEWSMGNELTVVPRFSGPLMPLKEGQEPFVYTTYSDGTTHSDGTPHKQSSITAELLEPLARGATTATISYSGGRRLRFAEPFGMVGSKYLQRAYSIRRVLSAPAAGAADGTYVFTFAPNAREPYAAGTKLNFTDPSCVMRPLMEEADKMWPTFEPTWFAKVGVTFEETFDMTSGADG